MSKGQTVAPWRPISGSGQSLALNNGSDAHFTNAVGVGALAQAGQQTRAIALSLAPAATAAACLVAISNSGAAATATSDILIKTTDPPLILMCSPGDKVHAWGLAAGLTLYLTELTQ